MKAGMQNILKAISKITDNADIKSIINSVNSNQIMSKEWLVDSISERLEFVIKNPKVCVRAVGMVC